MALLNKKIFILCILMFVVIVLFWWQLSLFFVKQANLTHLILSGVGWFMFLSMTLLFLVLIDNKNVVYTTFFLSFLFFFAFFRFFNNIPFSAYTITLLLFFALLVFAHGRILKEKKHRLKLSLYMIWKRGLPYIIWGLALIISVVYYFNPLLKIDQKEIQIPSKVFSIVFAPSQKILGIIMPFYKSDMTIDQMIGANQFIDTNQQRRGQLAESIGVGLQGNETIDIVLARLVNSKIKEFVGPYAKEISFGIAFALFLGLKVIGEIFSFIAIILSKIIFSLLLFFKVIKKEQIMKKTDVIKF